MPQTQNAHVSDACICTSPYLIACMCAVPEAAEQEPRRCVQAPGCRRSARPHLNAFSCALLQSYTHVGTVNRADICACVCVWQQKSGFRAVVGIELDAERPRPIELCRPPYTLPQPRPAHPVWSRGAGPGCLFWWCTPPSWGAAHLGRTGCLRPSPKCYGART